MATLEQELLADFADSGDEDVADLENDFAGGDFGSPDAGDDEDENMVDEEADYAEKEGKKKDKGHADIRNAQSLMANLQPVLQQIEDVKDKMEEVMCLHRRPWPYQTLGQSRQSHHSGQRSVRARSYCSPDLRAGSL